MPPSTRAAPSVAPPALHAPPPPLPADLARMFDEPFDLGPPLATPLATSPTTLSSSWLEQQQLAEVLEEQLTGAEAIDVSEIVAT